MINVLFICLGNACCADGKGDFTQTDRESGFIRACYHRLCLNRSLARGKSYILLPFRSVISFCPNS